MKKVFFFLLFVFFIDVAYAGDIYISKKDIDTGDYLLDCDFLLIDDSGNVVDSWVQDDTYHVSSVDNGSYELVSRPFVMGTFNSEMSDSYRLDVTDDVLRVTIYNKMIETPRNLSNNNNLAYGFSFVFIGLILLFYCKYYYI